jgi:hypothetical protein
MLIGSFASILAQAFGLWASVIAVGGAVGGFIALATGRPMEKVFEEFQLGAIAMTPAGFLLFLGVVIFGD